MCAARRAVQGSPGPPGVTIAALHAGQRLHAAIADVVRNDLLRFLSEMATTQRQSSFASAKACSLTDLTAISARIAQAVDVQGLDEAIRAGVCQTADFTEPSRTDRSDFLLYGADVTPAHIAAGLDVVRPVETAAVLQSLRARRHVILAGPSGGGKSTLLWRTARLVDYGRHIVRVLRVANSEDASLLVRHVRRVSPHGDVPVLVCADNLGRPQNQDSGQVQTVRSGPCHQRLEFFAGRPPGNGCGPRRSLTAGAGYASYP